MDLLVFCTAVLQIGQCYIAQKCVRVDLNAVPTLEDITKTYGQECLKEEQFLNGTSSSQRK